MVLPTVTLVPVIAAVDPLVKIPALAAAVLSKPKNSPKGSNIFSLPHFKTLSVIFPSRNNLSSAATVVTPVNIFSTELGPEGGATSVRVLPNCTPSKAPASALPAPITCVVLGPVAVIFVSGLVTL